MVLTQKDEIYKASRLSADGESSRRARVEDEPARDDNDNEDFGPEMPPEDDAGDDEEGRFFGGGISKQESQILDYVDEAEADGNAQEKIDIAWLRRMALNFEKHITKNAELRAKFESEPQKFISSEADLDADIKGLSILAEHPELYGELVKLGSVNSLVGLLAHENTDIAIDAIEIIGELTDEDVTANESQFNELVDALMDADLVDLLVSNFSRLNEDDESDRNGVYYALGVLENLCARGSAAHRIGQQERLIQWLFQRIQRKESTVTQNKQYAAEIIAILAQASKENRRKLAEVDAVDMLLQLVAQYRKRDPDRGTEEEEFMENIFEALTCTADEVDGKEKFLEAEGVELCLIMLKEGKMSKPPALRLLDHASSGSAGINTCNKLVEAGGLKNLFTVFMKTTEHRLIDHLLSIFSNMLRTLPSDSPERIRTLAKFVEKDYEKIGKLVTLHQTYSSRVARAEKETKDSWAHGGGDDQDKDGQEYELMTRRLDVGLYTLQLIAVVLAWLAAEDTGAKQRIKKLLADRDDGLDILKKTIQEQQQGIDTSEEENKELGEVLGTLVEFLR
jgi:beta-catenin-like protein 1